MIKEKYGVIYMIRNKVNNKIYFGQTTEKNGFDRRYKNNIEEYTHNEHLKRSIKKYGIDNFEIVKEFDIAYSKEELDKLEDIYIKLYDTVNSKCGYNKKYGGSSNGKISEETKIKMSIASKNVWAREGHITKMSNIMKAKWKDEEYINKISKSYTEERRENLSKLCFDRFKGIPKSEEEKIKNSIGVKKSWTDERRRNASRINKKRFEDESLRGKSRETMKQLWDNDDFRNMIVEKRTKKYVMFDTITKDYEIFKGRESLCEHIGMSLSYVQKYMSKELLHKDRYLLMSIEKFNKSYKKDVA